MQSDADGLGDFERGQVHHGNRAGGRGASQVVGDDRVPFEYSWKSVALAVRPASLTT